ncbi:armadillo-type protein [Echria macrotheca]|uniref:Armadillo-type protein n=1 Tax=Echria macrotheca TaxID=438768 RepID=A0AAJ0BC69_9PEZI|nr:armadillo-type protein [Echria macrotheca]
MDAHLTQLLIDSQNSDDNIRKPAELNLTHAKTNPEYSPALFRIAATASFPAEVRQAALIALKGFIDKNWSPGNEDGPHIPISEEVKEHLRVGILELAFGPEDEPKVKVAASLVVSKIAVADFPEQWPALLPTVLNILPNGTDTQLHAALRILRDLVEDSLTDRQFFQVARDIIAACFVVATNESRKQSHRAQAVLVFNGCFDLMDIVKDDYKTEVRAFADEVLKGWLPLLEQLVKSPLPPAAFASVAADLRDQPQNWNGPVALQIQATKTLIKIKTVFPSLLIGSSLNFFQATWEKLLSLREPYGDLFINASANGRLEDVDGLPFTLDFLVLEQLDLLNQLIRARPVQQELAQNANWVIEMMGLLVSYSRVSKEEEDLWDIDISLYLGEEASVSSNYTARTASGDLLIKVGEWLKSDAFEGLYAYTKTVFFDPATGFNDDAGFNGAGDWRAQEAALYLFKTLVADFQDCDLEISPERAERYLRLIDHAIQKDQEPLLRARGFLAAGTLAASYAPATRILDQTISAVTEGDNELIQASCVKALVGFIQAGIPVDRQGYIVQAIDQFLAAKDLTELNDADDLLVTLLETLCSAIGMDVHSALHPGSRAIDLLFLVARYGARNFQVSALVGECIDQIAELLAPSEYPTLCSKLLPLITAAFDLAAVTEDDQLTTLATEILQQLVQHGSEPLPPGFVASAFPKLTRLLFQTLEGEVLRPGADAARYMLMHDHQQVFAWQDQEGRSGLEVCLLIVDRLLGPGIEDNAASEVGGLAAELVEKAGSQRLGPYLEQLLKAVAVRLDTAQAAPFIQSLIIVFARLSLEGAQDVVAFLSNIQINGRSGLQVVLSKWLENSINFAGYDEIRQNVIALSKIYSLNDPRVSQIQVKGELIIPTSNRIMTRSRARQNPDQYTIISAPLKILKVLVEELLSASGANAASNAAAAVATADFDDADEDDEDDGWEDETDATLDLALGSTKADLMAWAENPNARQRDDETQVYLIDFFKRAARENIAGFAEWFNLLNEDEKTKLHELVTE